MTDFLLAGKILYGGSNPQANLYRSPLEVTLSPASIVSEEAFGSATINIAAAAIQPEGIASAEVFGDITIDSGAITLLPAGIESIELFGSLIIVDESEVLMGEFTATFRLYCSLNGTIGYQ